MVRSSFNPLRGWIQSIHVFLCDWHRMGVHYCVPNDKRLWFPKQVSRFGMISRGDISRFESPVYIPDTWWDEIVSFQRGCDASDVSILFEPLSFLSLQCVPCHFCDCGDMKWGQGWCSDPVTYCLQHVISSKLSPHTPRHPLPVQWGKPLELQALVWVLLFTPCLVYLLFPSHLHSGENFSSCFSRRLPTPAFIS